MTALTLDKQHDDNTNKVKVAKVEIISKGNNSEITIRIDGGGRNHNRSSSGSSGGSNGSSSTDNNNKATATVVVNNKGKTNTTINGDHDSNKVPDKKEEAITYLKDASKDKTTVDQKDDGALVTTTKDKDETLCISSSIKNAAICCCCCSSSKSNKKDIILEMLLQHKTKCNGYCEEYNDGDGSKPQKTPCRLCIRFLELMARLEKQTKKKSTNKDDDDHDSEDETVVVVVEDYHTVPLWVETTENYAGNSKRLLPYSQVHTSMLDDFDMNEVPTPAVPCVKLPGFHGAKRIIRKKDYVISYSLYQDDLNEFPYYWLGLKFNIDAIQTWFPGWTIHLYVDEISAEDNYKMTRRPFFRWMMEYAHKMGVPIEVFPTLKGSHPMLERYRPLMDMNTGVVLVRDIDSVLTLTEAKIVDAWLKDKASDVLVYSEYKMKGNACGGGISMKITPTIKDKRSSVAPLQTVIGAKRGRNYDECRLQSWLQKVTDGGCRQTIVQNRMNDDCIYCIDFYNNNSSNNNNQSGSSDSNDPKILWSNARYHKYKPPSGTNLKPAKTIYTRWQCEEECQRLIKEIGCVSTFQQMHVYAHQKENRNKLLRPNKNNDRLIWCR